MPVGFLQLIVPLIGSCLLGCQDSVGDYVAASAISRNGLARNGNAINALDGREIAVWGFVDHGNLYGDAGARAILGDWWSGDGPTPTRWRFNLKARADDATGHSFPVRVPNDRGRDDLLKRFVAHARAGKSTKVFLKGRVSIFAAPTNVVPLTGLSLELTSSRDILFDL